MNKQTIEIIIPMAGHGKRFRNAGFTMPKPLIQVNSMKPMIEVVIDNLRPKRYPYRFTFIVRREHAIKYGIDHVLRTIEPNAQIAYLEGDNDGCPVTLLENRNLWGDVPIMIANCDQYIDHDIDDFLDAFFASGCDGFTMTATNNDPSDIRWSYVKLNENMQVVEVKEKEAVSSECNTGIFLFRSAFQFFDATECMIHKEARINGEFYISPIYNEIIDKDGRVGYYNVGTLGVDGFYGLGVPADLRSFEQNPIILEQALITVPKKA